MTLAPLATKIPTVTKQYVAATALPELGASARTRDTKGAVGGFGYAYLGRLDGDGLQMQYTAAKTAGRDFLEAVAAARDLALASGGAKAYVPTGVAAVTQASNGSFLIAPAALYDNHDEPDGVHLRVGDRVRSARDYLVAVVGPDAWVDLRAKA